MASNANNPIAVIRQGLGQLAPEFKAALPAHVSVEKFTRVAQTAIQNDPTLAEADRKSLFGSIVRLAQMGLLPDGREAALVIFNQKTKGGGYEKKVQAMPMIAGLLKMVRQSGELASIDSHVVYTNDQFTYRPGVDAVPIFEPNWFGDRGQPIGAYALAILKDGTLIPPEIMNYEQIDKVRNVSKASSSEYGPWNQWWTEMARKTVMRRLSKRLPMSTDLEDALDRDETLAHNATAPTLTVVEAAPLSRLDAIEAQIEQGRADEDHGDQFDDRDSPQTPRPNSPGAAPGALWRSLIEGLATATTAADVEALSATFDANEDEIPIDRLGEVQEAIEAAFARFSTGA